MPEPVDRTRLIPNDEWKRLIERPEVIDDEIERCKEAIRHLRDLRRLSVRVHGIPGEEEVTP
jgi:hypothetical protein